MIGLKDRFASCVLLFALGVSMSHASVTNHKPGVRPLRETDVTITDVRSNKAHYNENEQASTRVTVVSTASVTKRGRLVALMHLDMDTVRELSSLSSFYLRTGDTKQWVFTYNVGTETYGRAIEIRFEDDQGNLIDSWSEYYAVAAEYFRVHTHTYHAGNNLYEVSPWTTYLNQRHYFASEMTDYGIQPHDAQMYVSGQVGYLASKTGKQAEIAYYSGTGVNSSFYQNWAFCGQMGYEEMRKYPEYVLYDANGQFAVDSFFGGYPNPMELASPIEVGPNRVAKPHLDLQYTPWQHVPANLALEDTVVYGANSMKQFAPEYSYTGVYFDGNVGVTRGYGYDGAINVPSNQPADYAALNARNHQAYSQILKSDNPNFGTWYNWSFDNIEPCINAGLTSWIGSGSGSTVDFGDDSIRAATNWPNVMLLFEVGRFYRDDPYFQPEAFLGRLIRHRDWAVQTYGANGIVGYSDTGLDPENPGPSNWAWPAVNYVCAQFIATQMHFADAFLPSHRPTLQFMTRYSRFLWAPDIKVLANEEQVVSVSSPETIWWRKLVYRRETAQGYDLIVHLVRVPPMQHFDVNWADEPTPLQGVEMSVELGTDQLTDVHAMRPCYYEEDQQAVETVVQAQLAGGKATIQVPSFRYHTMLVFRVVSNQALASPTAMKTNLEPVSKSKSIKASAQPHVVQPDLQRQDKVASAEVKPVSKAEQSFSPTIMQTASPDPNSFKVLVVFGLYTQILNIDEALAGWSFREGIPTQIQWANCPPNAVQNFPGTYADLSAYNTVVLSDVNFSALGQAGFDRICDYVRYGGNLLITGGPYALGNGEFPSGRFLDMLPVTLSGPFDLKWAGKNQSWDLTPASQGHPLLQGVSFAEQPKVFWHHYVTPKAGAEVVLRAGNQPLLVTGNYGAGRVAVLTLSPTGKPASGETPWWAWDGWFPLTRNLFTWLNSSTIDASAIRYKFNFNHGIAIPGPNPYLEGSGEILPPGIEGFRHLDDLGSGILANPDILGPDGGQVMAFHRGSTWPHQEGYRFGNDGTLFTGPIAPIIENEWTIEFFLRPDYTNKGFGLTDRSTLIDSTLTQGDATTGFNIRLNQLTKKLSFDPCPIESGQITSTSTLEAGQWYHVAAVVRTGVGQQTELWINGMLDGVGWYPAGWETQGRYKIPGYFNLGAPYMTVYGKNFQGEIDALAITADALNANSFVLLSPSPVQSAVGISNKAMLDPMMTIAATKYIWVLWGKVTVIDSGKFTIDDGSGVNIEVTASNHGLVSGDYVSVKGTLDASVPTAPKLTSQSVTKYN